MPTDTYTAKQLQTARDFLQMLADDDTCGLPASSFLRNAYQPELAIMRAELRRDVRALNMRIEGKADAG